MNTQQLDPKAWLDGVDEQWNAHNLDGILATFADDAVVRFVPPLPGAPNPAVGHEQIRQAVAPMLPGFRVSSRDHQLKGADTAAWRATASNNAFRGLGIDEVEADGEAVVRGGKIKSFTIRFTPETIARLQSAMTPAGA